MAFFDFKTIETSTQGYHDLVLPLQKISDSGELLFQEVNLILDNWKGEYLFDISQGMDYEAILDKTFDFRRLESMYFNVLLSLRYFVSMENFEAKLDADRELHVSFCVLAESGEKKDYSIVVLTDSMGNILVDPNAILTP